MAETKPKEVLNNLDMNKFWYPVCFSETIKKSDTKPHRFKLLGEPFVLFRNQNGKLECFEDRCPHRSAPLSIGIIDNFNGQRSIECKYHGWRFGENGKCIRIPSVSCQKQETLCSTIHAYTRPVCEENGIIWVWPNNTKGVIANKNYIPKEIFREANMSEFFVLAENQQDIPFHYSILMDNFLDVAHLDFTHDGTIGSKKKAVALQTILVNGKEIDMKQRNFFPKDMIWDQTLHQDAFSYKILRLDNFKGVGLPEFAGIFSFIPPCFVRLDLFDYTDEKIREKPTNQMILLFCVIPMSENESRLVIRFYSNIPFMKYLLKIPIIGSFSNQFISKVIGQDLDLLKGVQENINNYKAGYFSKIVNADSPIKRYRDWEKQMKKYMKGNIWFKGWQTTTTDIEDLLL
ncbi:hypothetical protein ABK040_015026 [Willaertia magna]